MPIENFQSQPVFEPIQFPELVRTEEDTEFLLRAINERFELLGRMMQGMGIPAHLLQGSVQFNPGPMHEKLLAKQSR